MATKKAQAPQKASAPASSSNDWAKWVYLGGVVLAGLAGALANVSFVSSLQPYLGWLLLLAGILSGIFFLDSDDVVNFGIRFLLFVAVSAALSAIPFAGSFLTGFFGGVVTFLGPVGLTLLVVYFWKKYFGNMM
jgi:hypothetical protein